MNPNYLDFEQPIADLEAKIQALRHASTGPAATAEAVTWTARSLSPRPPVPVLSGLLITAQGGEVSIASFDYETSAKLCIAA